VLLTGLALGYFSHTTSDRQLAHSSYNDTSADLLARSALDIVVSDFKQEIVNGSNPTSINGTTIYVPTNATNMVPQRSGSSSLVPNLIRRSDATNQIAPPGRISGPASAVNSAPIDLANPNRGDVTRARWNKHYLIPKANTGDDGADPIAGFVAPDWVFVTGQGPTVTVPSSSVIGRYAYAVYDEGGLLDVNLVGYPTDPSADPIPTQRVGRKGSLAYADLGALPYPIPNGPPPTAYQVDKLVGWRNYATTQPNNAFPDIDFAENFQSDATSATNFYNFVTSSTNPFLTVRSDVNTPPVGVPPTFNGRTDQIFLTRQELIAFRTTTQFSANALQHLGTFSREQNKPTWLASPLPPTSLLTRFPIGQLAFVSVTPPTGNAQDIHTYFGLQWDSTNSRWQYVEGGSTLLSTISPVGTGQPNLFQVLNYVLPGHTTAEILQLGACIIDQYDGDDVTTQIEYASPGTIAYGREGITPPNPPTAPPPPLGYTLLNRAFRTVGELGYAFNPITGSKLNFHASPSGNDDARLLDFFTINTSTPRTGMVNMNTRNHYVLAAILKRAITTESSSATVDSTTDATTAANTIVTNSIDGTIMNPALSRADVARLASIVTNMPFSTNDETRETIVRALAEVGQVRTWGLLIDVVAQTGRYKPNAQDLRNDFVVEGEKRYWLHIAIDRFDGTIVGQQLEEVAE